MKPESSRLIFLLGVVLLVLVAGAYLFASLYSKSSPASQQITDAGESITQKDPHSFTTFDSGEDSKKLKIQNQKYLNSYGWIDQENNVVHIPIDRAMEIIVERHANE